MEKNKLNIDSSIIKKAVNESIKKIISEQLTQQSKTKEEMLIGQIESAIKELNYYCANNKAAAFDLAVVSNALRNAETYIRNSGIMSQSRIN